MESGGPLDEGQRRGEGPYCSCGVGWGGASLPLRVKEGGGRWPRDTFSPRAGAAGPGGWNLAGGCLACRSLLPQSSGWERQGVLGPAPPPQEPSAGAPAPSTRDKLETSHPSGQADLRDLKA